MPKGPTSFQGKWFQKRRSKGSSMEKIIFILLVTIGSFTETIAQTTSELLSKALSQLYENSALPGFAVSIVTADTFLYQKSFGFENLATMKPYSNEQRFCIASISKTFIGIGLMKLVENGELELTTPINTILPFQVTNPYFNDTEITIEHLARHTSGILYGDLEAKSWYLANEFDLDKKTIGKTAYNDFSAWEENTKMDLGVFLKDCLSSDGQLYSQSRFSKHKPGESYAYSNLGAALAAYIIELKTGTDYREYIEAFLAENFQFNRGVWRSTFTEELPSCYFQSKILVPTYHPILFPAGGMMLSCDELSSYLSEMIAGFEGKSTLLDALSFQKMMTSGSEDHIKNGIFWELNGDKIGHNGGNYGTTCFMSFNKATGIGKIFMTNISSYKDDSLLKEMVAIWNKMDEYELKFE